MLKMNLILCVWIFGLILMHVEALEQLQKVTELKNSVISVSHQLNQYSNKFKLNLESKLDDLKVNEMNYVNDIVTPAITDAEDAITKSNLDKKKADYCLESMRQRLIVATNNAIRSLNNCITSMMNTLQPIEHNIELHILTGKMLQLNLNRMEISCISRNDMQTQLCIVQRIIGFSQSIETFKKSAGELIYTGDLLSGSSEITARHCFQTPLHNLHQDVSSIGSYSMKCIKGNVK